MNMKTPTKNCPCQSGLNFAECCSPYLTGERLPETPVALMRSRYTAYSLADAAYIQRTMYGPALKGFDLASARRWASQVEWLGLKIISVPAIKPGNNKGYVEFYALINQEAGQKILYERSEFRLIENRWYYYSGSTPKINRNDLCFCQSGIKFKNCCLPKF
ncbi:MAG: YchJ family protein [Proteobacteria bacterium]|nr:YchJ family protein [Pseudomonadota bacterium]